MTPDWQASLYSQFSDERIRPAVDLCARVPLDAPKLIVDLGCGSGFSTKVLAGRFPDADITGVDRSPDMLAAARAELPGVRFIETDILDYAPDEPVDLLYSNAVFHWLPEHRLLLENLMGWLKPGGVLAYQVPDNLAEPSHTAMEKVVNDLGWTDRMDEARGARTPLLSAEETYDTLCAIAEEVEMWRTRYMHPLRNAGDITSWFMSTGLKPFLDELSITEQSEFLNAYTREMELAYPVRADGRVILSFPRFFCVAVKG